MQRWIIRAYSEFQGKVEYYCFTTKDKHSAMVVRNAGQLRVKQGKNNTEGSVDDTKSDVNEKKPFKLELVVNAEKEKETKKEKQFFTVCFLLLMAVIFICL